MKNLLYCITNLKEGFNKKLSTTTKSLKQEFRPFNDSKPLKIKKEYQNEKIEIELFEEKGDYSSREEMNFNLIAIELSKSPFNSKQRLSEFKSIIDKNNYNCKDYGEHYGYMVVITNNSIEEINLLITGLGWGETATISKDTEEGVFVQSILKQAGALL